MKIAKAVMIISGIISYFSAIYVYSAVKGYEQFGIQDPTGIFLGRIVGLISLLSLIISWSFFDVISRKKERQEIIKKRNKKEN